MTNTYKWTKRTIAATALAGAALLIGNPNAEAATTNGTFTVQTTVAGACTIVTNNLTFGNYTTGQVSDVDANTTVDVVCPGVGGGTTLPVDLALAPAGGTYVLADGTGSTLNYGLYSDAPGGTLFGTSSYVVAANPEPLTIYGRIFGGQSPTGIGNVHQQTVTATLTY